ncbi:hypothetical protein ACLOJK_013969 [Asimina triloba]
MRSRYLDSLSRVPTQTRIGRSACNVLRPARAYLSLAVFATLIHSTGLGLVKIPSSDFHLHIAVQIALQPASRSPHAKNSSSHVSICIPSSIFDSVE